MVVTPARETVLPLDQKIILIDGKALPAEDVLARLLLDLCGEDIRQLEKPVTVGSQIIRLPDAAYRAGSDIVGCCYNICYPERRLARGIAPPRV